MPWVDNENISLSFSFKTDGNMFFGPPEESNDSPANAQVKANREEFLAMSGINPRRLVNALGIHNSSVYRIQGKHLGSGALEPETRIKNFDGLITDISHSYLMLTGADCFPVFFYDDKRHAAGAAHCGWRGILAGLPPKVITEFRKAFNSLPSDINVWLGPGIKHCHFEVQKDVVELFKDKYPDEIISGAHRYFIDLPAIIKRQLVGAGIQFQKITEHPDCTFCEKDKWFSSRRDKPKRIEANAFIIHLKHYDGK